MRGCFPTRHPRLTPMLQPLQSKAKGQDHFALKAYTRARNASSDTPHVPRTNGFSRMDRCRLGLECMDRQGWLRSFFQRKFHEVSDLTFQPKLQKCSAEGGRPSPPLPSAFSLD